MCIFSQPVQSVSNTQIFARLLPEGWQYLVYQMEYSTTQANAMILPLPVQTPADERRSLEFISLEDTPTFFDQLASGFPLEPNDSLEVGRGYPAPAGAVESRLEVQEVGDFIASFVPSMADFDRLDEQFRVSQDSWDKIPRYSDYGFAVFQLKSLEGKPHPMAFRFRSRLATGEQPTIFFPTVHIHDGEVHDREDFDHTLYLQSPEFDAACGEYLQRVQSVKDRATGYVRSKWVAGEFCDIEASRGILDPDALLHRLDMNGRFANTDVLAALERAEVGEQSWLTPQKSLPVIGSLASLFGMASVSGLAWLFHRRDKLAERRG